MNLLQDLLSGEGSNAVKSLGGQFGLSATDAEGALKSLIPSLAKGLGQNAEGGGLEALAKAVQSGGHKKYLENPGLLTESATKDEGNAILGHILGSKDVSRGLAKKASAQSGIGEDVLKQMLPLVATMVMGSLGKKSESPDLGGMLGGILGGKGQSGGGLGALGDLLDVDDDGNVAEEVLGMASKFFKR